MTIKVPFEAKTRSADRSIERLHARIARTGSVSQRSAGISSNAYRGIARAATAAAAAIGTIVGTAKGIGAADRMDGLNNRIRAFSKNSEEAVDRMRDVISVARSQHQSLAAVGTMYSRLQVSTLNLEVSQKLLAETSEAFAAGARITSASTQESTAAAIQFSQAMASGELRGEEFRSVMEQTPRVAIALADGLGVTTGKLREMAHAGKLTTAVVLPALNSQLGKLREESAKIPPTLAELKTQFSNSFDLASSAASNTTGSLHTLKKALTFVTEGMDTFTDTMRGGGGLGLALGDSIISGVKTGVAFLVDMISNIDLSALAISLASAFVAGPRMLIGFFANFKVGDLSGMISSFREGAVDFAFSLFDNVNKAFDGIDFARFGLRFVDTIINVLIEVLEAIADMLMEMVNNIIDTISKFTGSRLGPERLNERHEFTKSNLEGKYKGEGNVFTPREGADIGASGNPIDQLLAYIEDITGKASAKRQSLNTGKGSKGSDDGDGIKGIVDLDGAVDSASDALSGLADLTGNKVIGAMSDFITTFQSVNSMMDSFSSLISSLGGGGEGASGFLSSLFSTKAQAGGVVVPGSGIGDKVPALLEPGEVVVPNRQQDREALSGQGSTITFQLEAGFDEKSESNIRNMIQSGMLQDMLNSANVQNGGEGLFEAA